MAPLPKTPGVYIEEISKFPPSIAAVETAIPAFIGYTEKAEDKVANDLLMIPKRIVSMLEYERYFGGPQEEENITVTINETQDGDGNTLDVEVNADFSTGPGSGKSRHIMYYSLQGYFANGGGPCYTVAVGFYDTVGGIGTNIIAGVAEPPTGLYAGLQAIEKIDEITLIVFPEIQGLSSIADMRGIYEQALIQCNLLQDRFTVMDVFEHNKNSDILTVAKDFRDNGSINGVDFLKYGAVYAPNLETILDYAYDDTQVDVIHNINGTSGGDAEGKLNALEGKFDSFLAKSKLAITQIPVVLPVAPLVVGVYGRVDNSRGVWKAPANESFFVVDRPVLQITRRQQDDLNIDVVAGKSINAIRKFAGKGTLIWGARTLAGNDNEWRYISVRRFFNMVEESSKKATERFVFEPNDENTWTRVKSMIENFLTTQWRLGALQGATPQQAFYVKVGLGETMTALDILEGRMNVEIGMAVVRPAEFIILKFSHKLPEA